MGDFNGMGTDAAAQQEHKFLLDAKTAERFWAAVAPRLLPQHEDPARPYNFVRTTYFDTPDFSFYRSGKRAVAQRVRVREYASCTTPDGIPVLCGPCFLELKESSCGLRRKRRLPIPAEDDVTDHLVRLHAGPLRPCVTSWYRRTALADATDRIRITMDQGITFCQPVALGIGGVDARPPAVLAHGPAFVLEVKLWDEAPEWLTVALRGVREVHGFSKFIAGMRAARQWLAAHRAPNVWSENTRFAA